MPTDQEVDGETLAEGEEEAELCVSCLEPNTPGANFCAKCGAPLSAYSSTGPIERVMAEGFIYRAGAECPQKAIVVMGLWILLGLPAVFGTVAGLGGILFIPDLRMTLLNLLILIVSAAVLSVPIRSVRNYLKYRQSPKES
ncbi:MAG: zinc ribbon domain-containing protein [Verrucomicrobiae bacterium]|nr:zinc ribbon domain-containing protein [Verrucomicrobiae bacterium]